MTTLEDIKKARKAMEKANKEWQDNTPTITTTEKRAKQIKKNLKQIEKWVEDFSEKKSDSYWRDVEHNINAWCSIWEDSKKSKAYREQWNWIYKQMAKWWEE